MGGQKHEERKGIQGFLENLTNTKHHDAPLGPGVKALFKA